MGEYVHIVSLDSPAPPDYGGAIDIYYKIVSLAAIGKKVILHYFDYKAGRSIYNLDPYCYKIYSYKRSTGLKSISLNLPYIVGSRINDELIQTLNKDSYPVILEGIHCSGILPYINGCDRKIVIRLHNNEAKYYKALAKATKNTVKVLYYLWESCLLKRYQNLLPKDICIAALSESDQRDFEVLQYKNVHFVPSFIPWQVLQSKRGTGEYCLYHGNLTIPENEAAVLWLIRNIFSQCPASFVIAGKAPSKHLLKIAACFDNIKIIADPTQEEMEILVSNAQINILPSFNTTGVKIKLLNALINGRFCITNKAGVEGSHITGCLTIAENQKEMTEQICHLFKKPFSQDEADERKSLLTIYNNLTNAQKLSVLIS